MLYGEVAEFPTVLLAALKCFTGFALEEEVCERETRGGKSKTVESVR